MLDSVVLASGGLDSLVAMRLLQNKGVRFQPVFVDYGQRSSSQEYAFLEKACDEFNFGAIQRFSLGDFGFNIRSGLTTPARDVVREAFTPNRNLLLVLVASAFAFQKGVSNIVLGFLNKQTAIFPDQTDEFISAAEIVLRQSLGVRINIYCPLRDLSKMGVVLLARDLGIRSHYSCHVGGAEPCGKCIACLEYEGVS